MNLLLQRLLVNLNMKAMAPTNYLRSCLANILSIAFLAFAGLSLVWALGTNEPSQKEYAFYEVNYIHLSGAKMTTRLYLDAGGIDLKVGFCKGSYFIFQDRHKNEHDCNMEPLIYGATDIISFKKVKDEQ